MKRNNKKGGAKIKHRAKLLEFLGNPDNDFPIRADMARNVLKISGNCFYGHFTPDDLDEIEAEALEMRKKRSSRQRVEVYKALYDAAKDGNVKAIKEFLDRTEGKVLEKKELKIDGKDLQPILNVTTTGD